MNPFGRPATSLADRFAKYWKVNPANGCWEWTAYRRGKGYGQLRLGAKGSKIEMAHRVAWMLHRGPIPDGLFVCHRCDNPPCVNPDHLFLGTLQDNHADMMAKGRYVKGERARHAKLAAAQVAEIRRTSGPRDEVAARYGVSGSLISYIRRGDTWRHVA